MRIWTDGVITRAWHSFGILTNGPDGVAWEEREEGDLYYQPDFVVAPSPDGEDLVRELSLGEGVQRIDAAAVGTEHLAEILFEEGTASLHVGPPGDVPDIEARLVLSADPIEWPPGLLWKNLDDRFSTEDAFRDCGEGFEPRSVHLSPNQFGVGVAASGTGQIAVLRPKAKKLHSLGRVPTSAEGRARVAAIPLAEGALVVVTSIGEKRSKGAVIRIDDNGVVKAHWPRAKAAAPAGGSHLVAMLLTPDLVLVAHGKNVAVLGVDTLDAVVTTKAAPVASDVWVADDGAFALTGKDVLQVGRFADGKIELGPKIDPRSMVREEKRASRPALTWMPDKEDGPTTVEAAAEKIPPWTAKKGKPFTLKMRLRSKGVAGHGLRLRVLGPAIDDGLVEFDTAKSGKQKGAFSKSDEGAEAVLAGVPIPQGYQRPVRPKPKNELQKLRAQELLEASHVELELTGRALESGRALLKLQIGGLEGDLFRWTRPFAVE